MHTYIDSQKPQNRIHKITTNITVCILQACTGQHFCVSHCVSLQYYDTSASTHSLMLVYDHFMYIALEDLANDGDHKLLVGDLGSGQYDMKLKVFKGKNLMYFCTHTLTYSSIHAMSYINTHNIMIAMS